MSEIGIKTTTIFERNLNSDAEIIVNIGGVRSSKSHSQWQLVTHYSLNYPGLRVGIFRKVATTLKLTVVDHIVEKVWKKEFQLYESSRHNKTDRTYLFKNGSKIMFMGLDDTNKVFSNEFNLIVIEEFNDCTLQDFTDLLTRLSAPKPEGWKKNKLVMLGNMGNAAMGWVKEKVLTMSDVELIESTYLDNPFLPDSYLKTLDLLKSVDERKYKRLVLNEAMSEEGLIFPDWQVYDELPRKIEQATYGLDFGFNHASALVDCSFSEDALYVKENIYERGLTNTQLIQLSKDRGVRKDIEILADSAEPDRIEEFSIADFWINGVKKDTVFGQIQKVKNFKLYIHKDSKNIIDEIQQYKWRKNAMGTYDDKVEPNKQKDDAMAAIRYGTSGYTGELVAGDFISK